MDNIVTISSFLEEKIALHRMKMQELMAEARMLMNDAHEASGYNFDKLGFARDLLDKAVVHSKEIQRLESRKVA